MKGEFIMKPTDVLTEEHALIRQALDSFSLAVERLEQGERPPKEFFEKAVAFTRIFSDKFHHFKEEYLLFGRLAQKKNGAIDAQIDALRYQHDRGRDLIAEVSHAIDGYSQGKEANMLVLLENLAAYISMLRHHIHREDHVFYPMADAALSEAEQQELLQEFNKEEAKLNAPVFEDSRKLVMEMGSLL
jgi:hemerythrin-like domain-containing protein